MNNPRLNLWWGPRDPLHADNARRLSQFVTGLPDFDPIYQSWLLSPITKENTVSVPLSETKAKELLIDNMVRNSFNGDLMPQHGRNIWGGHAGPPPYDFRDSSYARHLAAGRYVRDLFLLPSRHDPRCYPGRRGAHPHAMDRMDHLPAPWPCIARQISPGRRGRNAQ